MTDYISPITITMENNKYFPDTASQIARELDNAVEDYVIKIISGFGVEVDRGELLRALQYDRDQYYKGYGDGQKDGFEK